MHSTSDPWAIEKPIIQLIQEAAYYSKNYSWIFGPGLIVNEDEDYDLLRGKHTKQ